MQRFIAIALVGLLAASATLDADAQRRLGGGRSLGRQSPQVQQRQVTPAPQAAPPQKAAPAHPSAAAPGTAPRPASPLKGVLLGLAAGIGLAALASHFGFGDTLTAVLMAAVLACAVVALAGYFMRRTRNETVQAAHGAGSAGLPPSSPPPPQRAAQDGGAVRAGSVMDEFARGESAVGSGAAQPWGVPADFDTEAFLRKAKDMFARLQAAWDRGNLGELQEFTTQDMFVALTHELHGRNAGSRTEVVALDAALLGIESTSAEYLASVRFSGTLRVDDEAEQVDEVWNLSKPLDGSAGWLLAGIQQLS
jgi:predicted lipid-binding transport protein (Tim44 family)